MVKTETPKVEISAIVNIFTFPIKTLPVIQNLFRDLNEILKLIQNDKQKMIYDLNLADILSAFNY